MDRPSSTSNSKPEARGGAPWAALVALAILATAELSARLFFTPEFVSDESYAKYYPAYDYGFDGDPVCWPRDGRIVCIATPYFDVWPQSFPAEKAEGQRRVIVIGSSVSRGRDPKRSYSAFLTTLLRTGRKGTPVAVVNLSASSIGSTRQLLRFREALGYTPDLFVIHVHALNEYKDERDISYSRDLHRGLSGLALESRFVVAVKKYYTEWTSLAPPAFEAPLPPERRESPEAWARWTATIDRNVNAMLTLAREAGVAVILVGLADKAAGFATGRSIAINRVLASYAGEGVGFLDTPAVLAAQPEQVGQKLFYRDKVHLTPSGHKLLAAALAPMVTELLGLDHPAPGKFKFP